MDGYLVDYLKEKMASKKQARNPGPVEKRIANSDGRTNRLTDFRTGGLTYWRTDQRTEGKSNI